MTEESSTVTSGSEPEAPATRTERSTQVTEPSATAPGRLDGIAVLARDPTRVVVGAGALATLVVAARTLVGVLYNLPFDPVAVPTAVRTVLAVGTPAVLALALVATGLVAGRPGARVGLLFAGVFGLLAVVDPGATSPAVAAVAGGGALALVGGQGVPSSYREWRRTLVAAGFVAGVAVSLASATAILDGGLRGLGATVALAALAALGVHAAGDSVALSAGVLVAVAVAAASVVSPFVVGSVLLTEFAVAGAPHLLVALAAGGAGAAAVAGYRRGEYALTVGALLLLLAGVPATLPRATAVVLGGALALTDLGGGRPGVGQREVRS